MAERLDLSSNEAIILYGLCQHWFYANDRNTNVGYAVLQRIARDQGVNLYADEPFVYTLIDRGIFTDEELQILGYTKRGQVADARVLGNGETPGKTGTE